MKLSTDGEMNSKIKKLIAKSKSILKLFSDCEIGEIQVIEEGSK